MMSFTIEDILKKDTNLKKLSTNCGVKCHVINYSKQNNNNSQIIDYFEDKKLQCCIENKSPLSSNYRTYQRSQSETSDFLHFPNSIDFQSSINRRQQYPYWDSVAYTGKPKLGILF